MPRPTISFKKTKTRKQADKLQETRQRGRKEGSQGGKGEEQGATVGEPTREVGEADWTQQREGKK